MTIGIGRGGPAGRDRQHWPGVPRISRQSRLLRMSGAGGFTLLELIVVCALIGIMLSLGIPSLRMAFFSDPLKSSARRLIGLTNGVRQLAIREQQPYLLHIDQSEKRIWYEREAKNEKEDETRQEKELRLPETVSIAGVWLADKEGQDQTTVWIGKQGYMEGTRIGLEDDEGNRLVVRFFPFLDAAAVDEDMP